MMIDTISWITVYPEIVLMVMACAILLIDLGVKTPLRNLTYVLTMLTLAVVAALEAHLAMAGQTYYGFGNMVGRHRRLGSRVARTVGVEPGVQGQAALVGLLDPEGQRVVAVIGRQALGLGVGHFDDLHRNLGFVEERRAGVVITEVAARLL